MSVTVAERQPRPLIRVAQQDARVKAIQLRRAASWPCDVALALWPDAAEKRATPNPD